MAINGADTLVGSFTTLGELSLRMMKKWPK